MANKRIVIGVPCYGNVVPEILDDWMRFAYHIGRRLPEFDFFIAIKTKSEQFRARNAIVEAAIQVNADYLLMIDDDMIIDVDHLTGTSHAYDFIEKLVDHDKDICGVLYYQRTGECRPVAMVKVGTGGYRFLRDDEVEHGLQKVDVAGGGCLLIKMRVFDKILQPYFEPEFAYGTDIQLCQKAAAAGFEVWTDTSIEFGHVREERVVVTSRNRHQFSVDTLPGEVHQFISAEVYEALIADAEEWTGYSRDQFENVGQSFMKPGPRPVKGDVEWYLRFPKERVARQVWFNTMNVNKQKMTEFIMATVSHKSALQILDFGCGIGIPAYFFANKGHSVTACDLKGTGTLEFLKWRVAAKSDIGMCIHETDGSVPFFPEKFDVIVAMDCLEHIEDWRGTLASLASDLKPEGVLFANNAILDDKTHPEHFNLEPADFVRECASLGLMPVNQITYMKGK